MSTRTLNGQLGRDPPRGKLINRKKEGQGGSVSAVMRDQLPGEIVYGSLPGAFTEKRGRVNDEAYLYASCQSVMRHQVNQSGAAISPSICSTLLYPFSPISMRQTLCYSYKDPEGACPDTPSVYKHVGDLPDPLRYPYRFHWYVSTACRCNLTAAPGKVMGAGPGLYSASGKPALDDVGVSNGENSATNMM